MLNFSVTRATVRREEVCAYLARIPQTSGAIVGIVIALNVVNQVAFHID